MISYLPLAKTLEKKSMNMSDLGVLLGISKKDISGYGALSGGYISTASLGRICKALDCEISDVIEWKEGDQKKDIEATTSKIPVDWDKIVTLVQRTTSLANCSRLMGKAPNFIAEKKKRGFGLYPIEIEKLEKIINVSREEFVIESKE